ncbi:CheR family methyltransferase [Desulfoplanes sp.]
MAKEVFQSVDYGSLCMSSKDFDQFSQLIQDQCGIKMPPNKKIMLEARLKKRLRALGYHEYTDYRNFVFTEKGREEELCHLIDVVTTNTTEFFRQPDHFKALNNGILERCHASAQSNKPLKVWSAGCSIGAEPYTLAIVLQEFAAAHSGFDYSILATDISGRVLKTAAKAVYATNQVKGIPDQLKRKYLLRSKDTVKDLVRIGPELRQKVRFGYLNFMENFALRETMDIVFCRNVIIYFNRQTQGMILQKICNHIRPGGYLFMGHSESLVGQNLPVVQIAPHIYQKSRSL